MIQFHNVTIQLEENCILQDFNERIHLAQDAVIIGPSGAGKSSLLKALAGFIEPVRGEITCQQIRVCHKNIQKIRQLISYTPQEFNDSGTVSEAIQRPFSFKANQGLVPSLEKITSVLEQLLLKKDLLNSKMSRLSGGERQRVGIAITALLDRPIWLMDEPTSALDPRSSQAAMQLILGKQQRTILSVSHDHRWIDNCGQVIDLNRSSPPKE